MKYRLPTTNCSVEPGDKPGAYQDHCGAVNEIRCAAQRGPDKKVERHWEVHGACRRQPESIAAASAGGYVPGACQSYTQIYTSTHHSKAPTIPPHTVAPKRAMNPYAVSPRNRARFSCPRNLQPCSVGRFPGYAYNVRGPNASIHWLNASGTVETQHVQLTISQTGRTLQVRWKDE